MKVNKLLAREKPFGKAIMEKSMERRKVHTKDILRLEEKIKRLDQDIQITEKIRGEVHKGNSISANETEISEDPNSYITPCRERKSMPVRNVRNTIGHLRGIITHMVDMVNNDPNTDASLSQELSNLVK